MASNEDIERIIAERERSRPSIGAHDPRFRPLDGQRTTVPAWIASKMPTGAARDTVRAVTHGLGQTGTTLLRFLDIPNRVFGNTRSRLQDIYESAERNMARDEFEDKSGAPQVGATAVHLASMGVAGRALPAVFGANVGADTYETARYAGASEGEAFAKGVGHGVVDTAIWTLGQGLVSKYLPKAWQWLGREIIGAGRGAASSVASDTVLNSLGADISGEEMAKRAVHAAWMVPLLGMLKMGGKRREDAMSLLRKARPDLAGEKADKVIETIEAEFSDPKSQKVALAWVARKGANLPDDTAQIRQALEVSSKVKGLDPMSKSPFEIISDPAYARYLPKPRPQDVKAFSNMKRYPMGVIGFDVSDDAAGRQATREMINAYMSPSSNPWCLATGKDAAKLGELGPDAEGFWRDHSAVPKQIFFQDVEGDGRLELIAFRATKPGGEGRVEYWDTSDAGYSGIPIRVKVPGDPMGRYRKFIFKPEFGETRELRPDGSFVTRRTDPSTLGDLRDMIARRERAIERRKDSDDPAARQFTDYQREQLAEDKAKLKAMEESGLTNDSDVLGTFEDIAPGKVFKGDPFRDGRSQTWVEADQYRRPSDLSFWDTDDGRSGLYRDYLEGRVTRDETLRRLSEQLDARDEFGDNRGLEHDIDLIKNTRVEDIEGVSTPEDWGSKGRYVLVEDKVRTTENGITRFRTTKYADPTDWDYAPPKPGEQPKPVEIEESELVSPEWMRARGYDPESESDVRRMQEDLEIRAWGNGVEAAMAVVPTKRTYMQTESGAPEVVTYEPDGRTIASVDFMKDGVPYREEYFGDDAPVGEVVSDIIGGPGLDIAPEHSGRTGLESVRLIRDPDGAAPEVLSETKYDKDLGSYVRTIGNQRSYMTVPAIVDDAEYRRAQEFENALQWRLSSYDAEGVLMPAETRDGTTFLSADQVRALSEVLRIDAQSGHPRYTWSSSRYDFPLLAALSENLPASAGFLSDLHTIQGGRVNTAPTLHVENRQPDGTWVPVETSNIQASPPRANTLPPPPDGIPLQGLDTDGDFIPFALKAGRTRRNVRAAEGGGDAGSETAVSETPVSEAPQNPGGPRIVVNPQVFRDKRDALCVAFNEAFRLVMEENGFEPVSEPTEKQRRFFADTAYADDELQLRRTILARIATLDTSVSDPTDEQLEETAEMLEMVMEVGAPQNEWEQQAVQRLHDVVAKAREGHAQNAEELPPPQDEASAQADVGGAFTPSEVLLPKKPDDLRKAASQAVEAYRAHVGDHPEDGTLLPPVYSDDPEDYRRYVVDLGIYGQLPGSSYAAEARKRLAGAGAAAYSYLTRPGLRADDGRSVPTIPENHLLNLPARFYAGAAASLSGMARAFKIGSSDAARVVRGPENLGTVMYEGSAADRLADRLGAMSRRFDARVVDAHPALGVAYAAGGLAPWFATRGATVPLMMASAMEAGRLDYDRAWMANGANPYDTASWWRTPFARGTGLGLVGMAPWGPWLRQGAQRLRLAVAPVAERAVVPYSPLFAALAEAPGAPSRLAGAVDAAAGIGAFTAADLLWPVGGGKPLPPPR